MAPGVSINAAIPGGKYGYKSGTSMATPHAAAAAMLLDMVWGKNRTPAQVEEKVHTATTNGKFTDQQMGYGSAMAFILAIIIFIVTAINFKGQDKWVKTID